MKQIMYLIDKLVKHYRGIFFVTVIGIFFAFFVLNVQKIPSSKASSEDRLKCLAEGWYYLDESGKKVEVTLPADIHSTDRRIFLYYDHLTKRNNGKTLAVKGVDAYNASIYCGDQKLYSFEDICYPRSFHNKSRSFTICTIQDVDNGSLVIKLRNTNNNEYHVNPVYLGSSEAVNFHMIYDSAFTLLFSALFAGFGFVALLAYVAILFFKYRERRLLHLGSFMLIYCTWHLLNCSYFYSLLNSYPVISLIYHMALALFPLPILFFTRESCHSKKSVAISICILISYVNIVLQGYLQYKGISNITKTMIYSQAVTIIVLVITTIVLIRDYRKYHEQGTLFCLIGFGFLYASGLISIPCYWLVPTFRYEYVVDIALLLLFVVQLEAVSANVTLGIRSKTELDIFRKLASEDALTGLRNRRGFEHDLEEMMQKLGDGDDIALVYMDLNKLKETNDQYGHEAGDQLLIAAANCIRNTFGEKCYRIGGDEFCALVYNPMDIQGTWLAKLDDAIQRGQGRYNFSVARGFSMLRDSSGNVKSASLWEKEADDMMYENKRASKIARR